MIIKNGPSWCMVSFKNYRAILYTWWHFKHRVTIINAFSLSRLFCSLGITQFFMLPCQPEILTMAQYFRAKFKDQGLVKPLLRMIFDTLIILLSSCFKQACSSTWCLNLYAWCNSTRYWVFFRLFSPNLVINSPLSTSSSLLLFSVILEDWSCKSLSYSSGFGPILFFLR